MPLPQPRPPSRPAARRRTFPPGQSSFSAGSKSTVPTASMRLPWPLCPAASFVIRRPTCDARIASAQRRMCRPLQSFFLPRLLVRTLLEAPRWGLAPSSSRGRRKQHLKTSKHIVPLSEVNDEATLYEPRHPSAEARLFKRVHRLHRSRGCAVRERRVEPKSSRRRRSRPDQMQAVRYLTLPGAGLRIICGKAGSGKTTMLRVAGTGFRASGATVSSGTAYRARPAESCSRQPRSRVTRSIADSATTRSAARVRAQTPSQAGLPRCPRRTELTGSEPRPLHIDRKTIVVVDEAGMVNSHQMKKLVRQVEKGGGTLVLLGDPAQLPPVAGLGTVSVHLPPGRLCRTHQGRPPERPCGPRRGVSSLPTAIPARPFNCSPQHRKITVRQSAGRRPAGAGP